MLKKTQILIAGLLLFISIQGTQASVAFSDVASNHEHYDAITYLQENGIVEGYDDNTFRPEQLVNRAEALKIILLGSEILVPEIAEQEIFPDVMHGSWYAKYTAKAKNLGIVSGDSDTGMFRPGDTVNLAEAMKMLLETNDIETEYPDSDPYWDVPLDSWFAPYFGYAESISLLDESSNENVYPATPVDRGMLAELMYRLTLKPQGYTEGEASYYGDAFHGKTTASGAVFDASGFTAAHKTLPFGTWLKVTNVENGESVYVEVTDRGPYVGDRVIDLSQAAFEAISPLSRGVITVSFFPKNPPSEAEEVEGENTNSGLTASLLNAQADDCPELDSLSYISKTSFDNITLENRIPNRFIEGEVLTLSGSTTSTEDIISVFLIDSGDGQHTYTTDINNGNFEVDVHFIETGTYKLGMLPGQSGSSVVETIKVLERDCIAESENGSGSPSGVAINLENGDSVISWNQNGYNLFKLIFTQSNNTKVYYFYDQNEFIPNYPDFENFDEGNVQITIQGANLSEDYIVEASSINWSSSASINFNAVDHYEYIVSEDEVELLDSPNTISKNTTFELSIDPKTNIDAEGAVILPSGEVERVALVSPTHEPTTNSNGLEVISSSANEVTLSYKPTSDDLYFVEINNGDGLAVINIPLYPSGYYPLLPNPVELSDRITVDLGNDLGALRNEMLDLVNNDRQDHNLGKLSLDSSLNTLAQYRTDDMTSSNYFSHYDSDGNSANDLRKNYAISQVVAENIAKDITLELAEYGLMRSAIHRANILNDEWTRVGFGISEHPEGGYIFVQIFSADPIDMEDKDLLRQNILSAVNEIKGVNYSLQSNLSNIAQSWSEDMSENGYFDFTSPSGGSLVNNIRGEGISASLGTYIVGNTSFDDAKDQIIGNTQIMESNWINLGIGIAVDEFGVIKITLIYTE
ncbi:septal ring lytic transglycosylase RlpA family protein [Patescibacteria group bacterium]|nr:septal ring lytic transglycosylase RlpA family protein [Patescibacteria group bacterium]